MYYFYTINKDITANWGCIILSIWTKPLNLTKMKVIRNSTRMLMPNGQCPGTVWKTNTTSSQRADDETGKIL